MEEKDKLFLESLGYKITGGYIQKHIDSNKEPKHYWENRPKTFEHQIWGWQIVAHQSKAKMFIKSLQV